MRKICLLIAALMLTCLAVPLSAAAETKNPQAVSALLDRIGGTGASERFVTVVDETLANGGKEVFVITAEDGKPCIKGSSTIAVTTGINWYLNHHARINLAWNCLTTDLNAATLPVPAVEERHQCTVDYRYYLNYCTYSYSCAMWTEQRWMQEIDWMALHGINMPLMLVGLDVIWHDIYTSDEFGYTTAELGKYVAGPAFQAWWGMTNLEGHGGPNPEWWYERQRAMCKNMLARMRELGMDPVLPGFYGTVPSNLATKMAGKEGYTQVNSGGKWQGYNAPGMLSATDAKFQHLAQLFYEAQEKVMGKSKFYSMDLCHEGGTAPQCGRPTQAQGIIQAMNANCGEQSVWVIQAWQNNPANDLLNAVPKGRLLVLDLFAENTPRWGRFGQHDFVYCMLLNFGGRTGLHGRFDNLVNNYNNVLAAKPSQLKGIGATPEGIETSPVMYDALFELPWTTIDKTKWVKEYATMRYGQENQAAQSAMQKLMGSVYNCPGGQQGTSEGVILAQPSLTVNSVSTWSTSSIPYDHTKVIAAADDLLSQAATLEGNNFEYDLLDVTRQAITDYAYFLLKQINADYQKGGGMNADFRTRKDCYLELIDDLDELLGSHQSYRFGNWTEMARNIVKEPAAQAAGATNTDADWLEYDNLRRQVSTWSDFNSQLREYSNREWSGMLRDYYKPRWVEFFNALAAGSGTGGLNNAYWYNKGCEWIKNTAGITYTAAPEGDTKVLAAEKFAKYFFPLVSWNGDKVYVQRHIEQELAAADYTTFAYRGQNYTFAIPEGTTAQLAVDVNNDGNIRADEQSADNTLAIPADAATSNVKATVRISDGTVVSFYIALKDEILNDRTVSVAVAEGCEGQGTVSIVGAPEGANSVTNKETVVIKATPAEGFDFKGWTQTIGGETKAAGTENPLTYYGADEATFTASFVENLWGIPAEENANEHATVKNVNSYLSAISYTQGENTTELYSATECPDQYFNPTAGNINVARGSKFSVQMTDAGGMKYCYLSAYIDLNRDGDFDDEGELIEVRGTKGAETSGICNNPVEVLLPYDMPAGLTHLRLRFDGAWKNCIPATGQPAPAKADLTRMTYEIPVNISEHALGSTHIVIRSCDENMGTVRNITGESGEDISVSAGTEIQPEAFPNEGYEFVHWEDQYGRVLSTEPAFKIIPAENTTFTAVFKKKLTLVTAGDIVLQTQETLSGDLLVMGVESGSGVLDLNNLSGIPEGKKLVGFTPGAVSGNKDVKRIVLPEDDIAFDCLLNASFEGAGTQNDLIRPNTTIPGKGPWTLTIKVATDGSSFNQWGSGLLAVGENALANSYPGAFQFYLKAAGTIVMKMNGGGENTFAQNVGSRFTIEMVNDGAGNFNVTLTPENGTPETKTFSNIALNDITVFSTALPEGVAIEQLNLSDPTLSSQPWKGCTGLEYFVVTEGNPNYTAKDGILYSADGSRMLAFPEGRLITRYFNLRNLANGKLAYATPLADADGQMTANNGSNRAVLAGEAASTDVPTALWTLVPIDNGYKVEHTNSQRFFGGKAGQHNRVEMPTSATQWYGEYTYDGSITAANEYALALKVGTYYVKNSDTGLILEETSAPDNTFLWAVDEVKSIPVTVDDNLWTALCLPVAVIVPSADDATVYTVSGVNNGALSLSPVAEGSVIPAGTGVLVSTEAAGTVSFALSYEAITASLSDNLLAGATLERTGLAAESFYLLGNTDLGTGFSRSTGTSAPANQAYIPTANIGNESASFLSLDGTPTGIGTATGDQGKNNGIWYDLRGRRVLYPAKGIYVNTTGEKVFID